MELLGKALRGDRGSDQVRIAEIGVELIETLLRKNKDYGCSVWKDPQLAPSCSAAEGIFVRMTDKVERIAQLRASGEQSEVQESLEDTIKDLAGYCLLYLAMPKEKDPHSEEQGSCECSREGTIPRHPVVNSPPGPKGHPNDSLPDLRTCRGWDFLRFCSGR